MYAEWLIDKRPVFHFQIALTGVTFLPTDESNPSKQELLIARKHRIYHNEVLKC